MNHIVRQSLTQTCQTVLETINDIKDQKLSLSVVFEIMLRDRTLLNIILNKIIYCCGCYIEPYSM